MGTRVLVNSDDIACAQVDGSHRAIMGRAGVTFSSRLALRVARSLAVCLSDFPPRLSAGDFSDRLVVCLGSSSTSELSPPAPKSSPAPALSPWFEACSGVWSSFFLLLLLDGVGVVFLPSSGVLALESFSGLGLGLVSCGDLAVESFGDLLRDDTLILAGMGTLCKASAAFLSAGVTRLYVRGLFYLFPVAPSCL